MNTIKYTLSAVTLGLLAISAPAFADEDERHYQQNQSQYISHEQAGKIAAKRVGGRVGEIDFEYSHRRGAYFEVEVFDQQGVEYDVIVDAKSGQVLQVRRDD